MASEKKIKNQQRFNESVKEELKLREKERGVLNSLISLAKVKGKISNDAKQTQQDLVASLTETAKLESESEKINAQIEAVQKAKLELIKEAEEKGEAINAHLINQLDATEEILKSNREQAGIKDELMNTTRNILGLDTEIEQAIAKGGVAALAMNKAFENIGASLTSHIDTMKEMVTQQGLSVKEAITLKGSVDAASFSLTGMLYGSDALASSASAIAEKFGNVNAATSDMIKGVTEVASLTGDAASATDLVTTFQNAGMEAGDVGDHIKELAEKHGVNAKKMMEGMTSQMSKLRGKTQEQLDVILEGNAALIKQGTNMEEIQNIADGVLDIEGNMRAAAKARVMLGRDMNNEAVRSAALQLESARTDEERAAAQKKIAEEILKGVGGQEEFAQMTEKEKAAAAASYGMDKEQLSVMMEKKRVQDELTAKYGDSADTVQAIGGFLASTGKMAGGLAMEMVKVIAKTAIMNMMMGKGSGIGGFFQQGIDGAKSLAKGLGSPLKSLKSLKDKAVDAFKGKAPDVKKEIMPDKKKISESVDNGGKVSGKGGMKDKLKDMAEGLKEMGDSKVFAGIGAVALAGPAFIIALPSIPFLLFMGLTPLKQLETNFSGLATGLNSMSSTFMGSLATAAFGIAAIPSIASIPFLLFMGLTPLGQLAPNFTSLSVGLTAMASSFMGSLALGAFAVAAGLAIASIPFLIAISLLGIAASAGLSALGVGLTALGTAAASGLPFLGIALIGAMGLAMIPFAIALNIATPAIEAFGGVIVGVMGAIPPIIGAIADGFVTMMSAISLENVGALFLLGPALMSAGAGMVVFGAAMLFGAPAILGLTLMGGALALLAPNLETFGNVVVNVMGAMPAIIQSIADGFVTMMGALSAESIGALMLLGPALMLASVGMVAFGVSMAVASAASFFGGGIIDDITELAMIGPQLEQAGSGLASITQNLGEVSGVIATLSESLSTMGSVTAPLYGVAGGLFSIAGGLTTMAGAGLLALPIFAAIGGLAAIAPVLDGLGSLFGGGDESESSSVGDSDMIDYDRLASVLQSQPIVLTIDGKAVQKITAVQRRQSKNARGFS